jgi:ribosome-binding factor A
VPDTAKHIDDLLAVARLADAEVERARENAVHAGEPDPYRKPREDSEESDGAQADVAD